jgi:hypothetical protein
LFKHEDPTFVGPCKYQAQGHCKFEGRCFFRHTDLDKPKKEKQNDARGAATEVAAKEAEAARRYAAEERRKGYDEGFEQGAAREKAKAEGFEQGVAFAREFAKQAARATAEEGELRKAATETRKAAEERLAATASETATALRKKEEKDKELAKAEKAKAKAKKKAKEKRKKQERTKKREQEDAQGPPIPIPPHPHSPRKVGSPAAETARRAIRRCGTTALGRATLAMHLLVFAAAYCHSAAQDEPAEGGRIATLPGPACNGHNFARKLGRRPPEDACQAEGTRFARNHIEGGRHQGRGTHNSPRSNERAGAVHSQHLFGQHHRPPEPLAAILVIGTGQGRFGSLSAGTAEPALQTGSGFFERPEGARGAGRADLPGGRSAPATPD